MKTATLASDRQLCKRFKKSLYWVRKSTGRENRKRIEGREKLIKDAVKARKERLEEMNNLLVEMRPEFAQAFQNCMSFSRKGDALVLL